MDNPKTKEERDALFATLFANMVPTDKKQATVMQLLEPYREQIVQKRQEGFSLRQISLGLKQEPLKLHASSMTVLKFLGGKTKHRRKKAKGMPALRIVDSPAGKPQG